jgi:hypothetical protein
MAAASKCNTLVSKTSRMPTKSSTNLINLCWLRPDKSLPDKCPKTFLFEVSDEHFLGKRILNDSDRPGMGIWAKRVFGHLIS